MLHKGSCHCGKVKFEVDADIDKVIDCNCSICARKGALLAAVSRDKFTLISGEGALASYEFNKRAIQHRFCTTCGIHPFAQSAHSKPNPMMMVNVRCLDGIDLDKLAVRRFDGRAL